jgi:hypothetical protein
MIWSELSIEERQSILKDVHKKVKFPLYIIEKDWWVVQTLRLIASLDVAEHFT